MKLIGDIGGVDVAVLPIGDNFTMGPEDAIRAAEFVKAKHVVPCHYNTSRRFNKIPMRLRQI